MEQLLGLVVHEDDVRRAVGDENRVGDVLENEVEAIALVARFDLGLTHTLDLTLQLARRAAQVGDVAQHRQHRVLGPDSFAERMGQHLEQQVVAFVRIDEIQLARAAGGRAGDRRAREERAEEKIVHLDRTSPARRIVFADEQQMLGALVLQHDVVRRVGDHDWVGKRVDHLLIAISLAAHALVSALDVEVRGDAKRAPARRTSRPTRHLCSTGVGNDRVDDDDAARRAAELPVLERSRGAAPSGASTSAAYDSVQIAGAPR